MFGAKPIKVVAYNDSFESQWEALAEEHPEVRYSHSIRYKKLIEDYSGFIAEYQVVLDGSEVVAILPLFFKNRFPRKLTSLPFADYGGALVLPRHVAREREILDLLGEAIREILTRRSQGICELKRQVLLGDDASTAFVRRPLYQLAQLPLQEPNALLKSVDHSVRKNINRATKSGLVAREQSDPGTISSTFYPMYLESMRRLSSVPHGLDFFLSAKRHFGDQFKIFIAWHGAIPVACLVGWVYAKRVVITQIASDDHYYNMRGPDLVHWDFIKWAHSAGLKYFDFSVVRYEGQAQYKRKWGSEFLDYHLDYVMREGVVNMPSIRQPLNDRTGGIRHLKPLFRHLVPCGVSRHIGKPIRIFMGK